MPDSPLRQLSQATEAAVQAAAAYTVTVRARRRVPASGIVWRDGVVITAAHAIEQDEGITVGSAAGERLPADLAGADPSSDIAVLRVPGLSRPAPQAADAPHVGALTLSVARPHDDPSASLGLVVARGGAWRARRGPAVEGYLRTDATMFPGFSGGPLVNVDGDLLGINTSLYAQGGGFAIPLPALEPIAAALLAHGRLRRAFLGLASQPTALPAQLAEAADGQEQGLLVVGVDQDGPSQAAGVLVGDIVIRLDVVPLRETADLFDALGAELIGVATELVVLRGGERVGLTVEPVERPLEGTGR